MSESREGVRVDKVQIKKECGRIRSASRDGVRVAREVEREREREREREKERVEKECE